MSVLGQKQRNKKFANYKGFLFVNILYHDFELIEIKLSRKIILTKALANSQFDRRVLLSIRVLKDKSFWFD